MIDGIRLDSPPNRQLIIFNDITFDIKVIVINYFKFNSVVHRID